MNCLLLMLGTCLTARRCFLATRASISGLIAGGTGARHALVFVVLFSSVLAMQSSVDAVPIGQAADPGSVDGRCIVIDSDAALDDFRAIALLAATKRVAAIVVTEGLSAPREGAGAVEALLARLGRSIPVIVGGSSPADRKYTAAADLPKWRDNAERLNGILPAPVKPSAPGAGDLAEALKRHVADCSKMTLLVIGPWTSFMRYAPEVLDRMDRIVAQGRPDPDEIGGVPSGFNCVYDLNACLAAFDMLVGRQQRVDRNLRATWVDIPNDPTSCGSAEPGIDSEGRRLYAFRPTEDWVAELDARGGTAKVIGEILRNNPSGWEQTSLWDDLAALYIHRPELFMNRGGHYEPCVPSATVRRILAETLSQKLPPVAR